MMLNFQDSNDTKSSDLLSLHCLKTVDRDIVLPEAAWNVFTASSDVFFFLLYSFLQGACLVVLQLLFPLFFENYRNLSRPCVLII